MPALSPAEIITVWESGSALADWGKALALLARGRLSQDGPEDAALRALSIGERNARLLALRRDTIGGQMRAYVKCPKCAEPLEFEQGIDELLAGYAPPAARQFTLDVEEHQLTCRLLDSSDLAAAAPLFFADEVREALITRALVSAQCAGAPLPANSLPAAGLPAASLPGDLRAAIEAGVADHDPLARLAIPLGCAACSHVWRAPLDIVAFFWAEIERIARTTLEDVVTLARAYGWSESEILAMSALRRQFYLEAQG